MDLKRYVPVSEQEFKRLMSDYERLTKAGRKVAYALPDNQIRAIARNELRGKTEIHVDANNLTNGMNEEVIKLYRAALGQSFSEIDQVQSTAAQLKAQAQEAIVRLSNEAPNDLEDNVSRHLNNIDNDEISDAEIKILEEKQQQAKIEVEQFRSVVGGRNPVTFNKFLYVIIMLAIGSLEFFINISAFNEIFAPAFAVAAAAIIGLMFAYSSHKVGMAVRSFPGLKNEQYLNFNRAQVFQQLVLGLIIFALAFSVVLYFRYDLLQSLFGSAVSGTVGEVLGLGAKSANEIIWRKMGEISLLNLGVWFLGVGISWATHDVYPRYPIAVKEVEAAERALEKCRRKFAMKRSKRENEREINLESINNLSAEQREFVNRLTAAIDDLEKEKVKRKEINNEGVAQAIKRYIGEINTFKGELSFIKDGQTLNKGEFIGLERSV